LKKKYKKIFTQAVQTAINLFLVSQGILGVKNRFCTTCTFPLNPQTMDGKMGPSEFYKKGPSLGGKEVAKGAAVDLEE
jgi:hypothetical protein